MAEFKIGFESWVEAELLEIYQFIAHDNPDAAKRVIDAVQETFAVLSHNPLLGRLGKFRKPKLKGIRFRPVSGFNKYLVVYRVIPGGIQVLHVFHGARNIAALLDDLD